MTRRDDDEREGAAPGVERDEPAAGSPPGKGGGGGAARGKAIAVLAAVFLLGGVAGAGLGRMSAMRDLRHVMQGPPEQARANFRLEVLRRHLELNDGQTEKIRSIFAEADGEREKLMATCGPGLDDLRKRTDARVREVLTEDQRKRFEDLPARRGRPGGPPPGGPWPGPGGRPE